MTPSKKKPADFESSMERLEEITSLLETGDTKLEEALKLYTEGLEITGVCSRQLNEAEKKIKLIADKSGIITETDFDVDEE